MALSLATLGLFVLLLPGLIFRYRLYHGTPVKRAITSSNALLSSLLFVLFAVFVHLAAVLLAAIFLKILKCTGFYSLEFVSFRYLDNENSLIFTVHGKDHSLFGFAVNYYLVPILYFVWALLVGWHLARLVQWLSGKHMFFSRMLFGPLAKLMMTDKAQILTAFVLTKVHHENRRLLYAGFPTEIGLRDGSKIDYIVLEDPAKFYLKLGRAVPITSFDKIRPISEDFVVGEALFISASEIENVHFEGWPF